MKKLMILAAIAMLATVTNAAAVGWTIMGASAFKNGDYSVFVVGNNGVTDAAQIVALVAAGTDVSGYAFADGTVSASGVATVTAANSGKSISYSGSGTDSYSAFAVIWAEDGKSASYTSLATISMANDSQSKTFAFGNQSANLGNNTFAVVPEPTSGLLMLVGLGAIALRRRRA
ncbi:MAG: PEP-CTERM sorting domain-containing protein [Kiritimatiellae bacterium]|nr:PEP-CTERM sorting domain-containing protein [Kiritimatiellia bacterium]